MIFMILISKTKLRFDPKLTDDKIYLQFNKKMKVNLTEQVLSHKVAAGIFTLVKTNYFNEKSMPNALYIKKMDAIFIV